LLPGKPGILEALGEEHWGLVPEEIPEEVVESTGDGGRPLEVEVFGEDWQVIGEMAVEGRLTPPQPELGISYENEDKIKSCQIKKLNDFKSLFLS